MADAAPAPLPSSRSLARVAAQQHPLPGVDFPLFLLGEHLDVHFAGIKAEGGVFAVISQILFPLL